MRIPLNNDWLFAKKADFSDACTVRLPHTNVLLPFNYTDETSYQFVSHYRKTLTLTEQDLAKSLILTFDGVAHVATVTVNGTVAASHNSGYTAFSADISALAKAGENVIDVTVDSRESANIPPFGNVIDYLTYGGIYREVYLDKLNKTHLDDVFVKGFAEKEPYNLCVETAVSNCCADLQIKYIVSDASGEIWTTQEPLQQNNVLFACIEGVKLWSVDSPNLYFLTVQILSDDEVIDSRQIRFGFRTAKFMPDGFYLNGVKVPLRGLNRHQCYPYVGYAMPCRVQRHDAEILKNELCVNMVRTSHYPQSHHFIDACDELGLLVFTEIPGWQHIGDEQWQAQALQNVREMVLQYRNHPSIVCWGVRINESQDCDKLYSRTNALARELDDSRMTAGVRFISHSNLLEDVYSYNDFHYHGDDSPITPKNQMYKGANPMLVTEFNGHMYPTKSYDDEAHRTEHTLRHLAVMNGYYAAKHLSGGIGWCMNDYNTHCQFGSGDKICHHGVCDMFRNFKLAASAYAMQGDKPYMQVSSTLDRGEWQASNLSKFYVFTNADSVKMYRNGEYVGQYYPDVKHYSALPHAPIIIDDFIGDSLVTKEHFSRSSSKKLKKIIKWITSHGSSGLPLWLLLTALSVCAKEKTNIKGLTEIITRYVLSWGGASVKFAFEGVYGGEVKTTATVESVTSVSLSVTADTLTLCEGDTYDVATVNFKAVDQNGNLCPYSLEPIELKAFGAIELMGDAVVALRGGMSGCYVKSTAVGKGTLTATFRGVTQTIEFTVKPSAFIH